MATDQPNPFRAARSSIFSASGYAAVWATENTREAIFSAMKRREVYATTGPRIILRFFGGWDFNNHDASSPNIAKIGYKKGVPMGGDLVMDQQQAVPHFLIAAMREPNGANLDRLQVIKGWRDQQGNLHEKVYDVVWSGERTPKESCWTGDGNHRSFSRYSSQQGRFTGSTSSHRVFRVPWPDWCRKDGVGKALSRVSL